MCKDGVGRNRLVISQAGSGVVFESRLCYCFVFYMVLNYLFRINGFV